jgi:hypothetical protein
MQGQYHGGKIARVVVHGREEFTFAENAREEFVLRLLQGATNLKDSVFLDLVWFPSPNVPLASRPPHILAPRTEEFSRLNRSQQGVGAAMISPTQPIVIVHGAPFALDSCRPFWFLLYSIIYSRTTGHGQDYHNRGRGSLLDLSKGACMDCCPV